MPGQNRSQSRQRVEILLVKAKGGSEAALGGALEECRSDLTRSARRVAARRPEIGANGSDLVQDAFVSAVRGFARFQGTRYQEFKGWLHRILLNRAAELTRKRDQRRAGRSERPSRRPTDSGLLDRGQSPSSIARHKEFRKLVQVALAALPLSYQEVLRLRFDRGLSFSRDRPRIVSLRKCCADAIQSRHGFV